VYSIFEYGDRLTVTIENYQKYYISQPSLSKSATVECMFILGLSGEELPEFTLLDIFGSCQETINDRLFCRQVDLAMGADRVVSASPLSGRRRLSRRCRTRP
jgi:hypothetical protein